MLACLAEAVGTEAMTPSCEQVLLQIQFFMSRDFKLDPHLYKVTGAGTGAGVKHGSLQFTPQIPPPPDQSATDALLH